MLLSTQTKPPVRHSRCWARSPSWVSMCPCGGGSAMTRCSCRLSARFWRWGLHPVARRSAGPEPAGLVGGFVILTIGGERLELARPRCRRRPHELVALAGALAIGAVSILLWPVPGAVAFGLVVLALSAWSARHDVARRTIRSTGLARYVAACILASQVWMAIAGGVWLVGGAVDHGAGYDAVVHAVFLGFTMSMIMAHAPVILPAVTRIALPFHLAMYAPSCCCRGHCWSGSGSGMR